MVGSFLGHPTGQKAAAGGDAGGNGGNGYHSLSAVCVPISVQNAFYPCLVLVSQEMAQRVSFFFFPHTSGVLGEKAHMHNTCAFIFTFL